jgi:hypothetical protein
MNATLKAGSSFSIIFAGKEEVQMELNSLKRTIMARSRNRLTVSVS